jgi:hypothetical protein
MCLSNRYFKHSAFKRENKMWEQSEESQKLPLQWANNYEFQHRKKGFKMISYFAWKVKFDMFPICWLKYLLSNVIWNNWISVTTVTTLKIWNLNDKNFEILWKIKCWRMSSQPFTSWVPHQKKHQNGQKIDSLLWLSQEVNE